MTTRSFARCTRGYDERPWTEWPEPLRDREPHALEAERHALRDEILFRSYLQWVAGEQWATARSRSNGVALFGDLPFMVNGDSADVWSRQDEFGQEGSVGVPPDAFSETGQDWGLPPYLWDVMRERDFSWLRLRARRMAHLFDGYRVDHVVGFYRTFVRPRGGGRRRVHSCRRAVADRTRRTGAERVQIDRRRDRRRGSRAPCRTSCANRWRGRASRATRYFAGNGIGTRLVSRSGTHWNTRPSPLRRRAHTTPSQ